MGFSTYAAVAGATAALAGTAISYSASQDANAAAARANQQAIQAQNTAFQARQAAQRQQTQEQAAVQNASQQRYETQREAMRAEQDAALTQRQDTISKLNLQQQALSDQTQQQVQQTTQQQITDKALAEAQAASAAQRRAGSEAAPPPAPQAASPIVAPGTGGGSPAARSALAKEMADAAAYSQDYARRAAALGSYSAPTDTTRLATTQLGTALMPAAAADRLLKSGANALILPSQTAYENATNFGKAAMTANTADTDENMALTKMRATNAVDLANLQQENDKALIQTGLNMAQARAASKKALGSGLSSVGNAALMGSAAFGGGAGLFDKVGTGIGNLFDGYAWNGMATGAGLQNLSGQALSNIAGGAPGL